MTTLKARDVDPQPKLRRTLRAHSLWGAIWMSAAIISAVGLVQDLLFWISGCSTDCLGARGVAVLASGTLIDATIAFALWPGLFKRSRWAPPRTVAWWGAAAVALALLFGRGTEMTVSTGQLALVAPLVEELMRAVVSDILEPFLSSGWLIVLPAAVFAVLHFAHIPQIFAAELVLQGCYVRTKGNLGASWICHMLYNGVLVIMLYHAGMLVPG